MAEATMFRLVLDIVWGSLRFLLVTILGIVIETLHFLVSPSRKYGKMVHPEDRWSSPFLRCCPRTISACRLVSCPFARALADRGHEVAVFNPAPAPSKLIAEAGLQNLPMPSRPMLPPVIDLAQAGSAWDVEEFFAALHFDEESTRGETAVYLDLIRDYDPDVVVDSFGLLTCLAARVLGVPLVTVLQGNSPSAGCIPPVAGAVGVL
jgi:hypothetical protein